MNTSISSSFRRHVRGGVESQQLDQLSLLLDTYFIEYGKTADVEFGCSSLWVYEFGSLGLNLSLGSKTNEVLEGWMENTRILAGISDICWGRAWGCKTKSLMGMKAQIKMESGNGEEKGTRLERAATARKDPNADNKRDEAIAYVRDQKAKSGNRVSTLCIFYNATGECWTLIA
ncbi:hypothetical protein Tco_0815109 [Tanacetum coccineum]